MGVFPDFDAVGGRTLILQTLGALLTVVLFTADLLVGSAEFNTIFHASQPFLDSVFALTFGARDPGPPPAQTAPANQ